MAKKEEIILDIKTDIEDPSKDLVVLQSVIATTLEKVDSTMAKVNTTIERQNELLAEQNITQEESGWDTFLKYLGIASTTITVVNFLWDAFGKKVESNTLLGSSRLDGFNQKIKELSENFSKLKDELQINFDTQFSKLSQEIKSLEEASAAREDSNVKKYIDALNDALATISTMDSALSNIGKLNVLMKDQDIQQYSTNMEKLSSNLLELQKSIDGVDLEKISSLNDLMKENSFESYSEGINSLTTAMTQFQETLVTDDGTFQTFSEAINNMISSVQEGVNSLKEQGFSNETMSGLSENLKSFVDTVRELLIGSDSTSLLGMLESVGESFSSLGEKMVLPPSAESLLIESIAKIKTAFEDLQTIAENSLVGVVENQTGLLQEAAAKFQESISTAIKEFDGKVESNLSESLNLDSLVKSMEGMTTSVQDSFKKLNTTLLAEISKINQTLSELQTKVDNLGGKGGSGGGKNGGPGLMGLSASFLLLGPVMQAFGNNSTNLVSHVSNLGNAIDGVTKNVETSTSSFAGYGTGLGSFISKAAKSGKTFGSSMSSMSNSTKGLGSSLKALAANPIGVMMQIIQVIMSQLQKVMDGNSESSEKLRGIMDALGGVFDLLLQAMKPAIDFILDGVVGAFNMAVKAAGKLLSGLASVAGALGLDGVAAKMNKFNAMMQESVGNIKSANKKIVENEKETSDDIVTSQENRANKSREIKAKEVAELQALQDAQIGAMEDGLEKMEAETRKTYDRQIESLKKRLTEEKDLSVKARNAINEQIEILEKQKAKELSKLTEENWKRESEKQLERLNKELAIIDQNSKRAFDIKQEQLKKEREIAIRYATANNLSLEAVNAKFDADAKKIEEDRAKANYAQLLADNKKLFQDKLNAVVAEGIAEKQTKLKLKQDELAAMKQLEDESDEDYKARKKALADEVKTDEGALFTARLEELKNKGMTENEAKLQLKQEELTALASLEGISEEERKNRQISLEAEAEALRQQVLVEEFDIASAKVQAYGKMFDDMGAILEQFGANSAALGVFSKAMALAEIGINTAKAIAVGLPPAMAQPFPLNIAAVATTVGTIMSNVANAKKLLSKEKTPEAPKFATGGLVTGEGSGTSDSITARLSSGESVITAMGTQMFGPMLSAFNQIGGGVPISSANSGQQAIGQEMLTEAFRKALDSMPTPVVAVSEINNVNKRVEVLESYGTL